MFMGCKWFAEDFQFNIRCAYDTGETTPHFCPLRFTKHFFLRETVKDMAHISAYLCAALHSDVWLIYANVFS